MVAALGETTGDSIAMLSWQPALAAAVHLNPSALHRSCSTAGHAAKNAGQ
jgi:hypothetical protein